MDDQHVETQPLWTRQDAVLVVLALILALVLALFMAVTRISFPGWMLLILPPLGFVQALVALFAVFL